MYRYNVSKARLNTSPSILSHAKQKRKKTPADPHFWLFKEKWSSSSGGSICVWHKWVSILFFKALRACGTVFNNKKARSGKVQAKISKAAETTTMTTTMTTNTLTKALQLTRLMSKNKLTWKNIYAKRLFCFIFFAWVEKKRLEQKEQIGQCWKLKCIKFLMFLSRICFYCPRAIFNYNHVLHRFFPSSFKYICEPENFPH